MCMTAMCRSSEADPETSFRLKDLSTSLACHHYCHARYSTPEACKESSRGRSRFSGDTPGEAVKKLPHSGRNGRRNSSHPARVRLLFQSFYRGCRLKNGSTPGYSPCTPPACESCRVCVFSPKPRSTPPACPSSASKNPSHVLPSRLPDCAAGRLLARGL